MIPKKPPLISKVHHTNMQIFVCSFVYNKVYEIRKGGQCNAHGYLVIEVLIWFLIWHLTFVPGPWACLLRFCGLGIGKGISGKHLCNSCLYWIDNGIWTSLYFPWSAMIILLNYLTLFLVSSCETARRR